MSNFSNGTTNCSYPYDSQDYATVALGCAMTASISLVASCLVIFIIILFKKWRFFSQRLVLYLAIAAATSSISSILHRVDYENQTSDFYQRFCAFGGFLAQISSWMLLNAISSITIYLFANIVLQKDTERFDSIYIFFIFIFPFTFNWIPFLHSSYSRSGAWCWIRYEVRETCEDFNFGRTLILWLWFIPHYAILLIHIILFAIIIFTLNRASKQWTKNHAASEDERVKFKKHLLPLMVYPTIYFFFGIPVFINRIQNLVDPNNPILGLWHVSYETQGGITAIAYCLDKETRKRLKWVELVAAFRAWTKEEHGTEYPVEYVDDQTTSLPPVCERCDYQPIENAAKMLYHERLESGLHLT